MDTGLNTILREPFEEIERSLDRGTESSSGTVQLPPPQDISKTGDRASARWNNGGTISIDLPSDERMGHTLSIEIRDFDVRIGISPLTATVQQKIGLLYSADDSIPQEARAPISNSSWLTAGYSRFRGESQIPLENVGCQVGMDRVADVIFGVRDLKHPLPTRVYSQPIASGNRIFRVMALKDGDNMRNVNFFEDIYDPKKLASLDAQPKHTRRIKLGVAPEVITVDSLRTLITRFLSDFAKKIARQPTV